MGDFTNAGPNQCEQAAQQACGRRNGFHCRTGSTACCQQSQGTDQQHGNSNSSTALYNATMCFITQASLATGVQMHAMGRFITTGCLTMLNDMRHSLWPCHSLQCHYRLITAMIVKQRHDALEALLPSHMLLSTRGQVCEPMPIARFTRHVVCHAGSGQHCSGCAFSSLTPTSQQRAQCQCCNVPCSSQACTQRGI